jgi:hypothetical protein
MHNVDKRTGANGMASKRRLCSRTGLPLLDKLGCAVWTLRIKKMHFSRGLGKCSDCDETCVTGEADLNMEAFMLLQHTIQIPRVARNAWAASV